MKTMLIFLAFFLVCFHHGQTSSSSSSTTSDSDNSQLLVVAFPGGEHSSYYSETLAELGHSLDDIVDMFVEYAYAADEAGDEFMVIYPENSEYIDPYDFPVNTYFLPVSEDMVLDLWMRDYPLVTPDKTVKFKYEPRYLEKWHRRYVDCQFIRLLKYIGVWSEVSKSNVALDGGNIVDTPTKAIATERTMAENPMSKADITREIESKLGRKLCWLMDPGEEDTTGHADGIVSFLDENNLLLLKDNDTWFYETNLADIHSCWPHLNVIPMPSERRSDKITEFASAIGGYVNGLMTGRAFYLPQFTVPGGEQDYSVEDAAAKDLLTKHLQGSGKVVKLVNTGKLSAMGGSVRCMTWQVGSDTPVGLALKAAANGEIPEYGYSWEEEGGDCADDIPHNG